MHSLKILEDKGGIPPDIPVNFDAALFFVFLRAAGGNPRIHEGGLYCDVSPHYSDIERWAALHDPVGERRLEYARSVWKFRQPGEETIYLG